MPLEKKDAPANKAKAEEPAAVVEEEEDPRNQPHPGDLTPGMYAEQEVGYSDAEPGSPEQLEHSEKFNAAKRKQRFGL